MAIDSLEQQALDRVARMYSSYDRRQDRQRPQDAPPPKPRDEPPAAHDREPAERHDSPPEEHRPAPKPPGLLDALMEDKEQSLLMLLLIILMKDGADMNVVLALMYVII